LPFIKPDEEAAKYQIWPRFAIERAAAHASTVFTTGIEVTAGEAQTLLGRRPDAILPNGLNIRKFAALHEFQNLHRQYKERIHEFVMGHFFPSYTFDLDNTLYLFTSGRYEYRNKGMDLFIEALHRLNQRLRGLPAMFPRPTVVAFIITRASTRSINVGVLQNQSMFDELSNTCLEMQEQMGRRLFQSAATGRIPTYQELLPDDAQVRLKRAMHAWRSSRQPTIVTHDLVDDAGDPILKHLRHRGMFNAADDPVKMVFHPEFVTATGPLINLDYEQFVRGCHLGVFPSYNEPWGYTPMEDPMVKRRAPTVQVILSAAKELWRSDG
jgi:glycogen(starch) synthase